MTLARHHRFAITLLAHAFASLTLAHTVLASDTQASSSLFTAKSIELLESKEWLLAKSELENIIKTQGSSEDKNEALARIHSSLARCITETQGASEEAVKELRVALELSQNPRFRVRTLFQIANQLQTQKQFTEAYEAWTQYLRVHNHFVSRQPLREIHYLAAQAALFKTSSAPDLAAEHLKKLLLTPILTNDSKPNRDDFAQLVLQLPQSTQDDLLQATLTHPQLPPSTPDYCFVILREQMKHPDWNVSANVERLLSHQYAERTKHQELALDYYINKEEHTKARALSSSIMTQAKPDSTLLRKAESTAITLDFLAANYPAVVRSGSAFLQHHPSLPTSDGVRLKVAKSHIALWNVDAAHKILAQIKKPELISYRDYELAWLAFLEDDFTSSLTQLEAMRKHALPADLDTQSLILLGRVSSILNQAQQAEDALHSALKSASKHEQRKLQQESYFELLVHFAQEQSKNVFDDPLVYDKKIAETYQNYHNLFPQSEYGCQMIGIAYDSLSTLGFSDFANSALTSSITYALDEHYEAGLENAFFHLLWQQIAEEKKPSHILEELRSAEPSPYTLCLLHALAQQQELSHRKSFTTWGAHLFHLALVRRSYASIQQKLTDEQWIPSYVINNLANQLNRSKRSAALSIPLCTQTQGSSIPEQRALGSLSALKAKRLTQQSIGSAELEELQHSARSLSHNPNYAEDSLAEQVEILFYTTPTSEESGPRFQSAVSEFISRFPTSRYRARMRLLIAKAHIASNTPENAIPQLNHIFTNHTNQLEVSAPAVNLLCQITWNRNNPATDSTPSDKQIAYQLGHRFLSNIQQNPSWKENIPEVAEQLTTLSGNVKKWENSGEVTPVQQLLKDFYEQRFE